MIKSFEGIRGIAALIVALSHLQIGAAHFSVIRNGYLFVDLFFVLSGFVICAAYSSTLRSPAELRPFLLRRIGRLLPLLVFSTIVFVLRPNLLALAKQVVIASGYSGLLENPEMLNYYIPDPVEILATVSFTHALGLFDHLILNTPAWSISVEFYTYIVFALVCLLLRGPKRLAAFAMLSVVGLLVSIWASVRVHNCIEGEHCLLLTYDFGFVRCLHSFFLGALMYYARPLLKGRVAELQLTVLFVLCMLFSLVDIVHASAFAFPAVFAALILTLSADVGPVADALKQPLFQVLGQRSYSIYLMHMPLLPVFEKLSWRTDGLLAHSAVVIGYIVVLYIVSGWTLRFIENPSRAYFHRLASGRQNAEREFRDTAVGQAL